MTLYMHYLTFLWLVWTSLVSCSAHAQQRCLQQARTSYEELYCQIKAEGEGASLPSLADFRRNPPETQALLLRRPAASLGLSLPAKRPEVDEIPDNVSVANTAPLPAAPKDSNSSSASVYAEPTGHHQSLAVCIVDGDVIRCGDIIFRLAMNQDNHHLTENALANTNRLLLQPYQGNEADKKALRNYLIDAYQLYIEKMLEIGLGASTMSFTKFYYTYQTLQEQEADFAQRMERMFDYLKQDKATMAVRQRYTDKLPADMKQCDWLGKRLIVCDEGEVNWVFVK